MITAEVVAHAIVAACKETDENFLDVCRGIRDGAHARHYALHALAAVYPDHDKASLVRCVGGVRPGKNALAAWNYSLTSVARKWKDRNRRSASWWDEKAFDRIVAAVRQASPNVQPEPYKNGPLPAVTAPNAPRSAIGTLEKSGFRPAPGTAAKVLEDDAADDATVFDRGRIAPEFRRPRVHPSTPSKVMSKREMAEDLKRAVENTQKSAPGSGE